MISLTPKKRFQETEQLATAFRAIVTSPSFEFGMMSALAEFSMVSHPTTEELNGARAFISVLLNMAEKEPDLPQFPAKHISIITDTRRKTVTQPPATNQPPPTTP